MVIILHDMMQLLGLASRAKKCVTGEDIIIKNIRNNQAKLVLVANDASDNTKKRYKDKCEFYKVPCFFISDIERLSLALGKHNRVAVGICDTGFAKGLLAKLTNKE